MLLSSIRPRVQSELKNKTSLPTARFGWGKNYKNYSRVDCHYFVSYLLLLAGVASLGQHLGLEQGTESAFLRFAGPETGFQAADVVNIST